MLFPTSEKYFLTHLEIFIRCLDVMLIRRSKHLNITRSCAFIKRLCSSALSSTKPKLTLALLLNAHKLMQSKKQLLDCSMSTNDSTVSIGQCFKPEVDHPDFAHAESAKLTELSILTKSKCKDIRLVAESIAKGSPQIGPGAICERLSRKSIIDSVNAIDNAEREESKFGRINKKPYVRTG
ncbi:hypothetical protein ACOME3_003421 [Neoechinorhynchus agilis]